MAEKHQVDKSIDELVDIRDVKLDSSLGQAERIQSFLQQIKNPYCFRVGDVVVNVAALLICCRSCEDLPENAAGLF